MFILRLLRHILGPLLFLAFVRSIFKDLFGAYTYQRRTYSGYGQNNTGYGGNGQYSGYSGQGAGPYSTHRTNEGPYQVFGLPRSATNEQIRARYRELVTKYHPDKFASLDDPQFAQLAAKKFQSIQDAYNELKRERGM